jgi:hypothetical protein
MTMCLCHHAQAEPRQRWRAGIGVSSNWTALLFGGLVLTDPTYFVTKDLAEDVIYLAKV